jgi:hypothetical protein
VKCGSAGTGYETAGMGFLRRVKGCDRQDKFKSEDIGTEHNQLRKHFYKFCDEASCCDVVHSTLRFFSFFSTQKRALIKFQF